MAYNYNHVFDAPNDGSGQMTATEGGTVNIDPRLFNVGDQVKTGGQAERGNAIGAAGADLAQQNQTRDAQRKLLQQLQQQASGQGPSLAQMQLQKAQSANIAQAMALGQSQRGAGQGALLKNIQNQQAGIASGMANDSAMARLQEQMAAQNMLGQNAQNMRAQDINVAGMGLQNNQFNAGQSNQMSQFNAAAGNQMNQFNAGQRNDMLNSDADRAAKASEANAANYVAQQKIEQEREAGFLNMIGNIFGAASMSDENVKTDIKNADAAVADFLDKVGVHEYRYKDEKHGKGRRVSPMAQEFEKSELGKEFVFETPDGKAVDYGKGLGTMVSAMALLHKRLKKVEGE